MKGRVLVAGFATRHVACSAKRAGYEVHAIDAFCDQDLTWNTKSCRTFEELDSLPGIINDSCKEIRPDILVVTSGAEDISVSKKISGSSRKKAGEFTDKKKIQNFFEENSINVPSILPDNQYPAMLKPCRGAGGWRNTIVNSKVEEDEFRSLWPDTPYVRQEFIEGIPCSVSCIASAGRAKAIAANLQYLRGGAGEKAFGFAGAATPFPSEYKDELMREAERIAALSGCTGSIGIDFILSDKGIYAIEINPRFQATLDIIEMSTGFNIFEAHINACRGILPELSPKHKKFVARKVIFAKRDLKVSDDMKKFYPKVADIPWKEDEIEEGGAIMSVYGEGSTLPEAESSLDKTIKEIARYISRW
ncbi:MAG: ATP-grasp domain-containing protein [Methanomicrobiaceae archaeon]|nr:ATP-grasp domain-containing protein [Methanomicrobiaceae archaeon]